MHLALYYLIPKKLTSILVLFPECYLHTQVIIAFKQLFHACKVYFMENVCRRTFCSVLTISLQKSS